MNYILHVNTFFLHQQKERQLNAHQISLYMALFQYWNHFRFQNPFPLFRENLMHMSGISSKNTYTKCLKALHQAGYIVYSPGLHKYHRPKASLVKLTAADPLNAQLCFFKEVNEEASPDQPETDLTGTSFEPLPVPNMGGLQLKIGTLPVPDMGHFNKQYKLRESGARARSWVCG